MEREEVYPRLRSLATALRERAMVESSSNETDQKITVPHLLDYALHDLAHTIQHLNRLGDDDVQGDEESTGFNVEHAQKHAAGAQDHLARLDSFLQEHASDPEEYTNQREALTDLRAASVKQQPGS